MRTKPSGPLTSGSASFNTFLSALHKTGSRFPRIQPATSELSERLASESEHHRPCRRQDFN